MAPCLISCIMGLSFLKKKERKEEEHLPPPPPPIPKAQNFGDFEDIRPKEANFEEEDSFHETVPNLAIPELSMDNDFEEEDKEELIEDKKSDFKFDFEDSDESVSDDVPVKKGPFFISVNDYEKIELELNSIRSLLNEADDNVKNLKDSLDSEQELFEKWRSFLEGIEKKLVFVDKIIVKSEE